MFLKTVWRGRKHRKSRVTHARCQVCGQQSSAATAARRGTRYYVPVLPGRKRYAIGAGIGRVPRHSGGEAGAPTEVGGGHEKGGIARARSWNKISSGPAGEPARCHSGEGRWSAVLRVFDHLLATGPLARWYEYGQSAALQGEPLDPCPYRRAILAGAKSYMGGSVLAERCAPEGVA